MKKKLLALSAITAFGGLILAGYLGYIWYIYNYDSGLVKPVKDAAYKSAKSVDVEKLSDAVYVLRGDGGNVTALIGDDGILIVDTDERWMAPKIHAALMTLAEAKVAYVINTHSHGDHRGGNGYFRARGAEVIAHKNTAANIKVDTYDPATPDEYPTILIDDEYKLTFNDENITIRHLPNAHTNGDIYVRFEKANVIATGDAFSYAMFPYISAGTGGSIGGHLSAQGRLADEIDSQTAIVPGHGPTTNRDGLSETTSRIADIRNHVAILKAWGIQARHSKFFYPTYAWRSDWRGPYITDNYFTQLVYHTLPDDP